MSITKVLRIAAFFILVIAVRTGAQTKEAYPCTISIKIVSQQNEYDSDRNVTTKTVGEDHYTFNTGLSLNEALLKRLENNSQKIDLCSSEQMCVLLNGDSKALGVNSPVTYKTYRESWSVCDDKLTQTYVSYDDCTLSDYSFGTVVSVMDKNAFYEELPDAAPLVTLKAKLPKVSRIDDIASAPLEYPDDRTGGVKNASLVGGNRFVRLYVQLGGITPNINPGAPKIHSKSYDCDQKEWKQNEPDPRYGISLPDPYVMRRAVKSERDGDFTKRYIQPLFVEKELFDFLKNPTPGKTFNLRARGYESGPNNDTQEDIYIEMKF